MGHAGVFAVASPVTPSGFLRPGPPAAARRRCREKCSWGPGGSDVRVWGGGPRHGMVEQPRVEVGWGGVGWGRGKVCEVAG